MILNKYIRKFPKNVWKKWFAWYPVEADYLIGGQKRKEVIVWLQIVERRHPELDMGITKPGFKMIKTDYNLWEYRVFKKLL